MTKYYKFVKNDSIYFTNCKMCDAIGKGYCNKADCRYNQFGGFHLTEISKEEADQLIKSGKKIIYRGKI